jgi:4-amino-4-deoxy-L-arabinose transferase-like glycosyltransferase
VTAATAPAAQAAPDRSFADLLRAAASDRWLAGIIGLALLARVAIMLITGDYVPAFDSADYSRHAVSIAAGNGYPESQLAADGGPTAFRPPLYPYLLGLVYAVSGDSIEAGRLLGALLGLVIVVQVYLLALRLWNRQHLARVAAGAAAFLPALLVLHAALLTEPLFIVLALAVALALLEIRRSRTATGWLVVAGLVCGLAALTRSNGILLLIPLVLGTWAWSPGSRRQRLAPIAILLAAAALTVAPWVVRTTLEFDRFVGIATQAGYGLAGTYNPGVRDSDEYPGSWAAPQFEGSHVAMFTVEGIDEAELDSRLREAGTEYAKAHPEYVVEVVGRSALRMAELMPARGQAALETGGSTVPTIALDLARLATWLLLVGAIAGVVVLVRSPTTAIGPWQLWLIPFLTVLPALPITGGARYRVPADPFLILLAAAGLVIGLAALQARRHNRLRSPTEEIR